MLTNNANPIYPVPEAIRRPDIEGPFEISEGYESKTDFAKTRMVVPVGGACEECGEDHARAARLLEMGRIAWSPSDLERRVKRTKDKLPLALVERCEEARINARRRRGGMEPSPPRLCESDGEHYFLIRQMVKNGDMVSLAGMLAASYATGDESLVQNSMVRIISELRSKASEESRIQAEYLTEITNGVMRHINYHMGWSRPTFRYSLSLARDILSILDRATTNMEKALMEAELSKQVKVKEFRGNKTIKDEDDSSFGKMSIIELPMPYRSKAGFERRWTARDEGDIPTRFDRWSIDKRIFRTKKRSKGATLLVDVSGSMSWSEDNLTSVLEQVPAATIAIYSGNGDEGNLVIVAKKGRCASMRQAARYMRGGNVVDGPALEWLAQQPDTVKLWMSDGGITGINDTFIQPSSKISTKLGILMRRKGIQQVRNAEAVMEILTGKKPFTPSRKVERHGWF